MNGSTWLGVVAGLMATSAVFGGCKGEDRSHPAPLGNTGSTTSSGTGSAGGGDAGGGGSSGSGLPAHCSDGVQNEDEVSVDCGGSCAGCTGDPCGQPEDCASQSCGDGKCLAPSCSDQIENGAETDVDCGGPDCAHCGENLSCDGPTDCLSGVCTNGLCAPPSCNDGVTNGKETGIDCGGPACPKCPPGAVCLTSSDCVSASCNSGKCVCPKRMVTASTGSNVTYCIDQTEVTNKDYVAFVNTPNLPAQDANCAWNASLIPNGGLPAQADNAYPIVNVDWCDAYLYCKVQGKRLCGALGGVPASYDAPADAANSIWYNACSGQGASTYPYGNAYEAGTCNGTGDAPDNESAAGLEPVVDGQDKPIGTCLGNFPSLYDMSGNVAEWEDACQADTGDTDLCRVRGGSNQSDAPDLACAADASLSRSTTAADVGFRCCQ